MKREMIIHLSFWFSFFIFITLLRGYFHLSYWPFWIGGLLGVVLPDIDHIIYAYFVSPQDLTSQRIGYLLEKKDIKRTVELFYETRTERRGLIFHSVFFQIIFFILTFWMMSSSGSNFGKGLVMSFSLHLLIDQIMDIVELGNFNNWTHNSPIVFDLSKAKIYCLVVAILLAILGVFV